MTAGQKADAVQKHGLLIHGFVLWQMDTKMERVMRYYTNRMETRKNQLGHIQLMFGQFATQLEKGIREGTPRDFLTEKGQQKRLSKSHQTQSLPDIHQKTPGSGNRGAPLGS